MRTILGFGLVVLLGVIFANAQSDQIFNLPGLNDHINFKQYAGYITVDPAAGRKLFYWFVESQNNPTTDPVVLWLNGGPGCSSVAGLFTEHGPFRPNSDGKTLSMNPNSWNRVANVVYLESPAGVGFSYSNNPADYNVGDKRTADDSYNFLIQFLFKKYPQFGKHKFWISGESYGGHYVPELAQRVMEGNTAGQNPKINLEGFLAGNAWTYMPIDNQGAIFQWWTHALISDETYNGIINSCDFSNIGPLKGTAPNPALCNTLLATASNEMGNINIYDMYVDVCTSASTVTVARQYARAGSKVHQVLVDAADMTGINPPYAPCIDTYLTQYLNIPDVQSAIHAEIKYAWAECSNLVNYNYSDVEKSVIPLYQNFFEKSNLKILVYSGDVDAIVPITGTRSWISSLKRKIVKSWTPYIVDQQVGGYVTVYDRFTFASVRNAGHMVPQTQPERAFAMFSRFITGKL